MNAITLEELKMMIREGIDYSNVDVSEITDFSRLFFDREVLFDITQWDVSNGQDFSYMFAESYKFNQDIRQWDVSNGQDFTAMLKDAWAFRFDISHWDVSNGKHFENFFTEAGQGSLFNITDRDIKYSLRIALGARWFYEPENIDIKSLLGFKRRMDVDNVLFSQNYKDAYEISGKPYSLDEPMEIMIMNSAYYIRNNGVFFYINNFFASDILYQCTIAGPFKSTI